MTKKEEKSIALIDNALVALIQKKRYEDITVSEIIQESTVSRSTFYSHFRKKEDVVNDICDEVFHHIFSSSLTGEKDHDFSHESVLDYKHIVVHLFYHVREAKEMLRPICSSSAFGTFETRLRPHVTRLMKASLGLREIELPSLPSPLALSVATSSFIDFIHFYVFSEDDISPESMAEAFYLLFPRRGE